MTKSKRPKKKKASNASAARVAKQPKAVPKKTAAIPKKSAAKRYTTGERTQFVHVLAFIFTLLCFVFLAMAYYVYG